MNFKTNFYRKHVFVGIDHILVEIQTGASNQLGFGTNNFTWY